ncbi:TolC family protein [Halobacteriovorax marinus]|nr:TolC family protein [Halobacteriovorax marinus]
MIKLLIFFLLLVAFNCNPQLEAAENGIVDNLLSKVREKSLSIQAYEDDKKSNEHIIESNLTLFETKGFVETSFERRDTPPLSPVSSLRQSAFKTTLGVSKIWEYGFETELSAGVLDSSTDYPNSFSPPEYSYISPTVEFKFKTSLFQTLLGHEYDYFRKKNEAQNRYISYKAEDQQKLTLVTALTEYAQLLEAQEELNFQKKICSEVGQQVRKLNSKYKKRSISRREYLLGMKENSTCTVSVSNILKRVIELENSFLATYNINIQEISVVKADQLFKTLKDSFRKNKTFKQQDKILTSEMKLLALESEATQYDYQELMEKNKPNLDLEIRAGSVGVNESYSKVYSNLLEDQSIYITAALKLELPIKNRAINATAIATKYKVAAINKRETLARNRALKRYETLKDILEKDFKIYDEYLNTISLSEDVYKEAKKDFNNGRLDFNDLSEFSKGLIEDQKKISTHRISLLLRVVEFLDYHNFFDNYIVSKNVEGV